MIWYFIIWFVVGFCTVFYSCIYYYDDITIKSPTLFFFTLSGEAFLLFLLFPIGNLFYRIIFFVPISISKKILSTKTKPSAPEIELSESDLPANDITIKKLSSIRDNSITELIIDG